MTEGGAVRALNGESSATRCASRKEEREGIGGVASTVDAIGIGTNQAVGAREQTEESILTRADSNRRLELRQNEKRYQFRFLKKSVGGIKGSLGSLSKI
jgi:hypothetical protein